MPEFYGLPDYPGFSANPVEAASSVPPGALGQIVAVMALIEWNSNNGKFFMMNMCAPHHHSALLCLRRARAREASLSTPGCRLVASAV